MVECRKAEFKNPRDLPLYLYIASIESLARIDPVGISMSTITPIPSSIGSTLPDITSDQAGRTPVVHLSTPMNPVDISPLGRSLAAQSSQRTDKNADIDNSDLPDTVKTLLKMIRELRAALEKKMQELREVQADMSLTPAQKRERMQMIQTEISGLSSALVGATQNLNQLIKGDTLTDDQKMSAGTLAMV